MYRISNRLRDGVEAAQWVIDEVKKLEVSYERSSKQRLHLLEKMESIDWPCTLDELPDKYKELSDAYEKLKEELTEAYREINKLKPRAVFDRDVHVKAKNYLNSKKVLS